MLNIGDKIPNFELKDQNGNDFELKDHLEKGKIILYFYPKDETIGCTKEACAFRDRYEYFTDAGAKVIGISSDSIKSHKQFAEKYNLPFTLLSDKGSKVRKLFKVPKTLGILPGRTTFVLNKDGIVIYAFNSQFRFSEHIKKALKIIGENKNER